MRCVESVGIGFQEQRTLAGQNFELVQIAFAQTGHEQLPDPRARPQAHRMAATVPVVEGADHADPSGVGRPDREVDAGDAVHRPDVRAEFFKNPVVIALGEQVAVLVAEDRERKGIGVLESPGPGRARSRSVDSAATPAGRRPAFRTNRRRGPSAAGTTSGAGFRTAGRGFPRPATGRAPRSDRVPSAADAVPARREDRYDIPNQVGAFRRRQGGMRLVLP